MFSSSHTLLEFSMKQGRNFPWKCPGNFRGMLSQPLLILKYSQNTSVISFSQARCQSIPEVLVVSSHFYKQGFPQQMEQVSKETSRRSGACCTAPYYTLFYKHTASISPFAARASQGHVRSRLLGVESFDNFSGGDVVTRSRFNKRLDTRFVKGLV